MYYSHGLFVFLTRGISIVLSCDMPKIVEIKHKQGKPTLPELINRLDGLFYNMVYRGEDRLNVTLATISFCISVLSLELGDKEVAKIVDEVLAQYLDKKAKK